MMKNFWIAVAVSLLIALVACVVKASAQTAPAAPGGPNAHAGQAPAPQEQHGPEPWTGPPPSDAAIVRALSPMVDSLSQAGAFSGVVLLDKDGKTLYERATGMASAERNVPNAMDTRFNLGSINKIFTHIAILQLAAQGKVALDSTVDHYLSSYPKANASRITVRQLIEHRGGVPDVFGPGLTIEKGRTLRTVNDWYALVRDQPLLFDPGTQQRYSNGGFVLLGAIIESVSGEDYYDYVRRHIYEPAGMTSTEHPLADSGTPPRATSYTRRGGPGGPGAPPGAPPPPPDPSAPLHPAPLPERGSPAGGGYSTAPDLVRFARALRSGRLVSAESAPQFVGPGAGFGVAGGAPGINAMLESDGPYTLVVLANLDPPAAEGIAMPIGRMLRAASPHDPNAPQRVEVRAGH